MSKINPMKTFNHFIIGLLAMSLVACNGEDDDVMDPVVDPVTETVESYMIIEGDTVPNTTQSVNYSDSIRTIFQTNFQNESHYYAVSYTITNPLDATKDYSTSNNRFFYSGNGAATSDSINLYFSDFNNDKNYISETGKTLSVVKNADNTHTISIDNLSAVEEAEGTTSISCSIKVNVSF